MKAKLSAIGTMSALTMFALSTSSAFAVEGGLGLPVSGMQITPFAGIYDWHNRQLTAPINVLLSQLSKIGKQRVQFGLGAKVYAQGPSGAPEWGIRFVVKPLFPTGRKWRRWQ